MFEREIQFIYDFSHNKIKKLDSFITFNELKSTNLHPAILQYISAEIDFYIFEDRQKLLKDSLFDYSGDKINTYFLQISDEIKKVKKFSQSYIEKLILHSVTFTVNHLVTPNSLISQFIFEENSEKSSAEIKQILNYLYYYPHISKIISSYLDKKNLVKINSEEFDKLLKKIDKIGFEADPEKIYNEALQSMAEFFNIGMTGRDLIPLVAVQNYLKDKELNNHLDKLQSNFVDAEVTRYEIKDYQKILIGLDIGEPLPLKESETEEVLESDLSTNALQSHSFEPVEEEEQIIEEDATSVDIKIMEDDSRKVILDEELVAEVEDDSEEGPEEKIEIAREEITDEQESVESEYVKDIIDEEQVSKSTASEEELIAAPEAEANPNELPDVDSKIIEIEDERELENEAIADVMELAKEEIKIETDEVVEGEEILVDEEMDDPVVEFDQKLDTISIDTEDTKELYVADAGNDEDEASPEEITFAEESAESEDERSIEEIVDAQDEEEISYIDGDDKGSIEFEEDRISGEKDNILEIDDDIKLNEELDSESEEKLTEEAEDKNDMRNIHSITSNNFEEEAEDEDLSEFDKESVDTLSYLLNEDPIKNDLNEEAAQDEELNQVAEKFNEVDEPVEFDKELSETDEEITSVEEPRLFEEDEESETDEEIGEISLGAEKEGSELKLDAGEWNDDGKESADSEVSQIDMSSLLENRKMSKVIDVIFDYDMEEFANAIEQIIVAPNLDTANSIIDKVCTASQISASSKEAKLFKSIIADYYNHK